MKNWDAKWMGWLTRIHHSDQVLFDFLKQKMTLIAAVIGIGLCILGFLLHNIEMSLEVVLVGAIGYLLGFIPAIVGGLILTGIRFSQVGFFWSEVPLETLVYLGCMYIAWLGREHKVASIRRKQEIYGFIQTAQVIPWSMVNEVRNSLLAMRLLLFSKHSETIESNLRLVEDELTRLDNLFHDLNENKESFK